MLAALGLVQCATASKHFTSAADARAGMTAVVKGIVKKLEEEYVNIASDEGGTCLSRPTAHSCDPDHVHSTAWRGAKYDVQFSNAVTKSCTRFDKNQQNLFLSLGSFVPHSDTSFDSANSIDGYWKYPDTRTTGKKHTCTDSLCPADFDCSATGYGSEDRRCKCNYNVIDKDFRRHVETVSKADFLTRSVKETQVVGDASKTQLAGEDTFDDAPCIIKAQDATDTKECSVNQDYYGYNLPDGKTVESSGRARAEICATNRLVDSFKTNAEKHSDINWNFMGMQETGLYRNYPLIYQCRTENQCSGCSDPRYRSWYAEAASGPKDVMIVVDTSGSMKKNNRIEKLKAAVGWVLNTLSKYDRASIVSFSSSARAYPANKLMMKMDVVGRAKMKDYVQSLDALGDTNMGAGLTQAFDIIENSRKQGQTSKCQSVMLFLTDGDNTGDEDPLTVAQRLNSGDTMTRIFSYSFGDDSNKGLMKRLACQNQGVWQRVPDSGDLKSVMAGYFMYLAAGLSAGRRLSVAGSDNGRSLQAGSSATHIRWSDWFEDGQGLGQIAGVCAPVFDRTKSAETGVAILFGVTCSSISKGTWDNFTDSKAVWAQIEKDDAQCPQLYLNDDMLEIVRGRVSKESTCAGNDFDDVGDAAKDDKLNLIVGVVASVLVVAVLVSCMCKHKSTQSKSNNGNARPVQFNNAAQALQNQNQQQQQQILRQQQQILQQQQQISVRNMEQAVGIPVAQVVAVHDESTVKPQTMPSQAVGMHAPEAKV